MALQTFISLDKKLENTLRELIEQSFNGCIEQFHITESDFDANEIQELAKCQYISITDTRTLSETSWLVSLTYNGKNYFAHKQEYVRINRNHKIIEWLRYGITTAISIAALIIALAKQ